MSFFASVKSMFTKTKNRKHKEKGVEMLGNVKPVYTRKVVGVSPKRHHRVMKSPPLRNKSNRRGRHPLGPLTPIESMSESSSRRNVSPRSRSSSSSRHLPALRIPSSSSNYSLSRTLSSSRSKSRSGSNNSFYMSPSSKSRSKSSSKSKSRSSSKSKSRSSSKSRSKSRSGSNNSFYMSPSLKSRSRSSRSRSMTRSKSKSSSSKVNTRRRIPRRKKNRQPHTTYAKRKIYRARIKTSVCRGIKPGSKCKRQKSCKYAMGEKRQFCRKRKNKKGN